MRRFRVSGRVSSGLCSCVPLGGEAAICPPADDVCISVRRWSGNVDSLDITIYTSIVLYATNHSSVHWRLLISLIAGISLWDPSTRERLAAESLDVLMNPAPVLMDIARQRVWAPGADVASGWNRGLSNYFEGRVKPHSAMLAIASSTSELKSRIWKS
jgi:hypothetical protein